MVTKNNDKLNSDFDLKANTADLPLFGRADFVVESPSTMFAQNIATDRTLSYTVATLQYVDALFSYGSGKAYAQPHNKEIRINVRFDSEVPAGQKFSVYWSAK